MGLDVLVTLGGLLLPPVVDFVKKKFLKPGSDTPEATMSSLATTKPEVLPEYVKAITGWLTAQTEHFNRDVVGEVSSWVRDLRAAIRPIGVIGSGCILAGMVVAGLTGYEPEPAMIATITGIRLSCEGIVSSWFGQRIVISS